MCNNGTDPSSRVVSLSFFLKAHAQEYTFFFKTPVEIFFSSLLSFFYSVLFSSFFNFVCYIMKKKKVCGGDGGTLIHWCWSPLKRTRRINSGSLRFFPLFSLSLFLLLPFLFLPKIAINKIMRLYIHVLTLKVALCYAYGQSLFFSLSSKVCFAIDQ